MTPDCAGTPKRLACMFALAALATLGTSAADLAAQGRGLGRGGGGMSNSQVASPTVVASWVSHESYADGKATTLLVLWRGTPAWFLKGGSGGSGGGGGAGGSAAKDYVYMSEGGLTFMMEFDYDKSSVKMLKEEINLKETNVVLVDFVDSTSGPTIVARRWVDPEPPQQRSPDPIPGVIKRAPDLFEYLRCDLSLPDPVLKLAMPIICGHMRP